MKLTFGKLAAPAILALCGALGACYVAPVISASDINDAGVGPGEDYVCEVYLRDAPPVKGTVTSHSAHWVVLKTESEAETWIPREQIVKVRVLDKPADRPDGDDDDDE